MNTKSIKTLTLSIKESLSQGKLNTIKGGYEDKRGARPGTKGK